MKIYNLPTYSLGQVLGVLERRISATVDWSQYLEVGVLGLDEIALRKGTGTL